MRLMTLLLLLLSVHYKYRPTWSYMRRFSGSDSVSYAAMLLHLTPAEPLLFCCIKTHLVVHAPLLRVRQRLIRSSNLLEAVFCLLLVARVPIRVPLAAKQSQNAPASSVIQVSSSRHHTQQATPLKQSFGALLSGVCLFGCHLLRRQAAYVHTTWDTIRSSSSCQQQQ